MGRKTNLWAANLAFIMWPACTPLCRLFLRTDVYAPKGLSFVGAKMDSALKPLGFTTYDTSRTFGGLTVRWALAACNP